MAYGAVSLISLSVYCGLGRPGNGFLEVGGLSIENEAIEYLYGSMPKEASVQMPGLRKCNRIVLKIRIIAGDTDFYNWINNIQHNTVERRDVVIQLLNQNHAPVMVWKVQNAWPCKIQASDLKANANEAAIETIELAHERLTIDVPSNV